ncbi:CoA transferase [Streptomyces monashensis]|uniref:CoA transferase n=1 Tax=Streptomyces monashensis TaxID=1678012 RepID=UPI003409598F
MPMQASTANWAAARTTPAALGAETAALWREGGREDQDVTVSVESAVHQLMAAFLSRVGQVPITELAEVPNLLEYSGFYRVADGRHAYVLFSYPQLILGRGPLIHIEELGESTPEPFSAGATLLLSGLRVLDNTHVIAGPIAARISAELGTDVLHLSAPAHPDPTP